MSPLFATTTSASSLSGRPCVSARSVSIRLVNAVTLPSAAWKSELPFCRAASCSCSSVRALDLRPLEEAQPAVDAVRDAAREERMLEHTGLRVRTVKDRHVRKPCAVARERLHFVDQPTRLVGIRLAFEDADRLARTGR